MNDLATYLDIHKIKDLHPSEIAKLLKSLNKTSFNAAIQIIPKEMIGDVALQLPSRYFSYIVNSFTAQELAIAVNELESDDQTDFMQDLEEVNDKVAQAVFSQLSKNTQENILHLKQYKEDEAGAYMQTEVYTAGLDQNVYDVIRDFADLRKLNQLENIHYLFVTDKDKKLHYGIGLDHLLTFDFQKTLRENIEADSKEFRFIASCANEKIENVVQKFREYDLDTMPIVNESGILLGRITSDDIYDIINVQATDQMYHLAGVDDDTEEAEDIVKSGVSRAIWLSLNLLTAIAASLVISLFEETLQSFVALAILMPIVASMGGNAGTQSLTVVVRQLTLGNISKDNALHMIKKEVSISVVNGILFAIIMGMIASVWFDKAMLGVVIALSMLINLLSAGFFGSLVPLMLKKLNLDPAIGSTVILTTVTDVVGFFSFLGLATIILL
ncbi:magnesium transporter [Sulfurovum sp.]|uniref:magnesium transporter n=1 Tax=Sulfurovum sp. TaxID=1969726 RepID=UPI002867C9D3|nr:magnesium transporter [Sulfurovum sp.]